MSKLDDWAAKQWAGMKQGASEVGRDMVNDVGTTYQAFLMSDAGWRVPRAHGEFTLEVADQAAAADLDKALEAQTNQPAPEADVGLEPTIE
jgi:hypothetical protein